MAAVSAVPSASLVDCRGEFKLSDFSGRDEDWAHWKIRAEAFFTLMGWDALISHSEEATAATSLMNVTLDESQVKVSKALHAVLTVRTAKKTLGIVMLAQRGEGFTAWRLLRQEYEPNVGHRHAAMLSTLLNPMWADASKPFLEAIVDWENDVARYQLQSAKAFAEEYKIATLLAHAPEPYRTVLRNAPAATRDDYVKLRCHARDWHQSGLVFPSSSNNPGGQAPMEIGASTGHPAGGAGDKD